MADESNIEWTDATWNPVVGCSPVSSGCANCYAVTWARRLAANEGTARKYADLTEITGDRRCRFNETVRCLPEELERPLRWKKPRRIFVCSMGDLFHPKVPVEFCDEVFSVMHRAPQHVFQILTKRPKYMEQYVNNLTAYDVLRMYDIGTGDDPVEDWPLPNVWLGTSAENQFTYNARVVLLAVTSACVRFLSLEPLLEPIDLRLGDTAHALSWVIVGGESGPRARECKPEWIASIVDQCRAADTPCFVKQLGSHWAKFNRPAGRRQQWSGQGADSSAWPEHLRMRQWPKAMVSTRTT